MDKTFIKKLVERATKTFVQAFAAALIIPTDYSKDAWKAAALAAVAAGLSAVISLVSKRFGSNTDSPSLV